MAEKLRIFPLLKTQLQFEVSNPVFESLATQILGNTAADSDGFNADLLAVAQQLESDTNLVSAGDADLAAAGFTAGEFAAGNIDPLVQQTGVFNSSGDGLLKDLGDDAQVPGTIQPAPECGTKLTAQDGYQPSACDATGVVFARHFGGWPKGDCIFAASANIFQGEQSHEPTALRVVSAGEAFQRFDLSYYTPGPPPGGIVDVIAKVNAANAGHFDATVEITWPDARGKQLAKLCIDIVDTSTLQSNVQSSVLPLKG